MELRYVPTDATSAKYKKNVKYYEGGCPKAHLIFVEDVHKILIGQNNTTGPEQYAMTRTLLRGDALRIFDNERSIIIGAEDVETPENLILVLNAVGKAVFPNRALVKQKRYMRRFLKKPREMSWRQFISELIQMNDKVEKYPPYATNQKLTDLEVLKIEEFGAPQTWQKNMIAHNFDCATKSISEVIEFWERQETLESLSSPPAKKTKKATGKDTQDNHKGGKPYRAKSSAEAKHKKEQSTQSHPAVLQVARPGALDGRLQSRTTTN